jgi:hypothetical protein
METRRPQVLHRGIQTAERRGRQAKLQLDGAHVDAGAGPVRDVPPAEGPEPRRHKLDILLPVKADGGLQPERQRRHAHRRRGRPGPERSRERIRRSGAVTVTLVQADLGDRERREDRGQAAGGIHGLGLEVAGEAAPMFGQAGGLASDVPAHLGEDRRASAEGDVVRHVAHQLERLPGQPHRLGEAPGGQRECGGGLQQVPSARGDADSLQADLEVGQLVLDASWLASLEEGVDPPQPAPHLDPGTAGAARGIEHPLRQHGPLGNSLGGAASQLAGTEGVHEGQRVARRFGDGQRVPADLACPFVPAAVDQGLGVTGRHPGTELFGEVVLHQGQLTGAADLGVPVGFAGRFHDQRRAGEQEPVTPELRPPGDPARGLLPAREIPATRASSFSRPTIEPASPAGPGCTPPTGKP